MIKTPEHTANTGIEKKRNLKHSSDFSVPIPYEESEQIGLRLKEVIGGESIRSFAGRCSISDGLLGAYLRNEKAPGVKHLVKMAEQGGVTVDWLATGREPKLRKDLTAAMMRVSEPGGAPYNASIPPEIARFASRYMECDNNQRRAVDALLEAIVEPSFRAWLKVGEYISEIANVFDRKR